MTIKNWISGLSAAFLITACGQNSTKSTGENDTTVNNETHRDNMTSNNVTGDTMNKNNMDHTTVSIPDNTRQAFTSKYPNATNVNWRKYDRPYEDIDWTWAGWPKLDTSAYQVTYTDNGNEYNAWYDKNNTWVGTVSNMDASGLPQNVNDVIQKNYAGYTVKSVKKENDKNRTAYEIKLEKDQQKTKIMVDENGRIIKK
jgi:hypothetical protein